MTQTSLTLTTPINDLRGELTVKELNFKQPRARLFRKYGSPNKIISITNRDKPNETRSEYFTDEETYAQFIADMTNLDSSQVDDLTAVDFERAKLVVWSMINNAAKDEKGNFTTPVQS